MSGRQERRGERSVRGDSPTNALRQWNKQRVQRRKPRQLEPLPAAAERGRQEDEEQLMRTQIQGPLTLQRLVDDFVSAAGAGDVDKVAQYIRTGIPIDRVHSLLRYNALHASTALRRSEIARLLLEAGADVNALTRDHETALHLAARYGCIDVARELMRYEIDKRIANNVSHIYLLEYHCNVHFYIANLSHLLFMKKGMLAMDVALDIQNRELGRILEPPPNAPTSVIVVGTSPFAVHVSWEICGSLPAPCLFEVSWSLNGTRGGERLRCECTDSNYQIEGLQPATEYFVGVKAGNHLIGWSTSSPLLLIRTDNDVPNAVKAPIVTEVGATFIKVRIELPRENGSEISRVALQSLCAGNAFQGRETVESRINQSDNWDTRVWNLDRSLESETNDERADSRSGRKTARVTGSYMELTADGLAPGHSYFFRGKAYNEIGWSSDGEISEKISTEDCPQVVAKGARTVTLVWTKAIVNGQTADSYRVDARLDKANNWETVAIGSYDETCSASGLMPFSSYIFRVVPHFATTGWVNSAACATSALTITEPAPPDPPVNLHLVEVTATTITVSWQLPRCNGHGVLYYELDVSKLENLHHNTERTNMWQLVNGAIPVGIESFTIKELVRGETYAVRVRAVNILGNGEFAALPHPVRTSVLFAPRSPHCVSKTSFSAHMAWEDDTLNDSTKSSGSEVVVQEAISDQRYELQMCQVEVGHPPGRSLHEWITVAKNLSASQCIVPDLQPSRRYCFRVRVYLLSNDLDNSQQTSNCSRNEYEVSSAFSTPSEAIQTLRRV